MTARLALSLALVATSLGAAWLLQGRIGKGADHPVRARTIPGELLPEAAQGRWAVLGFTSSLCWACQRTPAIANTAFPHPGDPPFVEIDVSEHPQLTEALDVRSTPTVVLLDPSGTVVFAHAGNPEPAQLSQAIARSPRADPGGASA